MTFCQVQANKSRNEHGFQKGTRPSEMSLVRNRQVQFNFFRNNTVKYIKSIEFF